MNEKEASDTTAKLKEEMESSMEEIEGVNLGNKYIQLPPYKDLPKNEDGRPVLSPEEYFKYINSLVKDSRDVATLVNEPFVKWTDDSSINDRLFPAYATIARGGGDCDNISWAAKELLDGLSCRSGHDYKARVIGCDDAEHAVTIYTGTDGRIAVIEQSSHFYMGKDIYSASPFFEKFREKASSFIEEESLGLQGRVEYSIDTTTLERDKKEMSVIFGHKYSSSFDAKKDLPATWDLHQKMHVSFDDKTQLFYVQGKMTQKTSDKTIEFYDDNGLRTEVKYLDSSNPIDSENLYPETGAVQTRHFKNGTREVYDPNGILLQKQSSYKNEFYNPDGHLIQIDYLEASDVIDSDKFYPGTDVLRERDFKPGQDRTTEFYNEQGILTQIDYSDGRIEMLDSTGHIVIKK